MSGTLTMIESLLSNIRIKNVFTSHLFKLLNSGHERSAKAKKNILFSLIFRGIDIGIGLVLVPLSLNFLDPERYGIWLIMESIVAWFIILDIGLGHGLRNKFAESYARNDVKAAKTYVSTAYAVLSIVCFSLIAVLFVAKQSIKWGSILNAPPALYQEVTILATVVILAFAVRMVLSLVSFIWIAVQFPAIQHLIQAASKLLTLVILITMYFLGKGTIIKLAVAYVFPPLFLLALLTVFTFRTRFRDYRPSLRHVKLKSISELMNLGIKFFILQMLFIVLITMDNLIITHLFGAAEVSPYQISHKYFGLLFAMFIITLTPIWSATTEAFVIRDYQWVRRVVDKYLKLWRYIVAIGTIMLIVSPAIYKLWIGNKVQISFSLSLCWSLLIMIMCGHSLYSYVINGVGYLYVQLIGAVSVMILKLPLSIFLAENLNFGPSGVILATIVLYFLLLITRYIQYQKIIHETATGLWAK